MKPTEGKIRLTAFSVLVLTLLFIWVKSPVIPAFLIVDFFLRAFGFGKFSPIMNLSNFIAKSLIFKEKSVFFPPIQFAAKIGIKRFNYPALHSKTEIIFVKIHYIRKLNFSIRKY